MANLILWLIARVVPRQTRGRWLEEWRGEIPHAGWRMLPGALPDAFALRRVATRPRRTWGGPWLTDARQTLRSLARAPWHVLTVTWCLGVGIAVTVTVFSILASLLSGDLPGVHDRSSLASLYVVSESPAGRRSPQPASLGDYAVMRRGTRSMPGVAAEGVWRFAVRSPAGVSVVEGALVSGNYFEVLGTAPAAGRLLTPSDDRPEAPLAIVIAHAFWTSQFGSRQDIAGRTLVVGGQEAVIVGVAPEHFSGMDIGDPGEPPGQRFRIFVPLAHAPLLARVIDRDRGWLRVYGRIGTEASPEAVAAEVEPLARRIEGENPSSRKGAEIQVRPSGIGVGDALTVIAVVVALVMAAPLTVLAIGCANVANLQLVRATLRAKELAVRSSLGATRGQLVRLLTIEAAMLAIIAIAAGMIGTLVLLRLAAFVIPFHSVLDWPVLLFVVVLTGSLVVATGLVPALVATKPGEALTMGSQRSVGRSVSRLRRGLVVAQVALSLVLLLVAAVFTRCLQSLAGIVPAAASESVVADIRFDVLGYTETQREAAGDDIRSRLASDPRVDAVGFNAIAPFRRQIQRFWLAARPDDVLRVDTAEVTAGWFAAAGLATLHGRTFVTGDLRAGNIAVVNQAFVERHRLGEAVLGTVVRVDSTPVTVSALSSLDRLGPSRIESFEIVGVVANELSRPLTPDPAPRLYFPLRRIPDYVALYVRTSQPAAMAQQIRETMASVDAELPAVAIASVADRFHEAAGEIRLLALAASGISVSALALALAGVYAVVAFFVSLRTREFGIRLAIGANPSDIVSMVLAQASRLVGAGLMIGLVLGTPASIALVRAFPYTSAFDPIALIVPVMALAVAAAAAALLPARRASRVDPCSALRTE